MLSSFCIIPRPKAALICLKRCIKSVRWLVFNLLPCRVSFIFHVLRIEKSITFVACTNHKNMKLPSPFKHLSALLLVAASAAFIPAHASEPSIKDLRRLAKDSRKLNFPRPRLQSRQHRRLLGPFARKGHQPYRPLRPDDPRRLHQQAPRRTLPLPD